MILMPHIFDVTANENARYKRNELEFLILTQHVCNTSSDWTVGKSSGSKMTIYVPQLLCQNAVDSLAQLRR